MDAKAELEELRRLEELEAKASSGENSFGIKLGANLVSGFGKTAAGIAGFPDMATTLIARALKGVGAGPLSKPGGAETMQALNSQTLPAKAGEYWNEFGQKEGFQNPVGRATVEGAGGGVLGGVPGIVGGAAGGGTEKFIGDKFGPMAGSVAGIIASILAARQVAPQSLTAPERRLRDASQGVTPDQFSRARDNAQLFAQTGARTATLPETIPGNTPLLALANEVRSAKGGERLANRVAGREADLQGLGEEIKRRIGPAVNTSEVAGEVSDAANRVTGSMSQVASTSFGQRLAGRSVPTRRVAEIYRGLKAAGAASQSDAVRAAYDEVADQLVRTTPNGRAFITDLQTLSGQLKRLKDNPLTSNASAARKFEHGDIQRAVGDAETMLSGVSPEFKRANEAFAAWKNEVERPVREGIIGKVGDKNPYLPDPTPAGRLNAIVADQTPQAAREAMQTLGAAGASPQRIAQALVSKKLERGSLDPGATLRGLPGSPAEQTLSAVLREGGGSPSTILAPARAADLLQNFKGVQGSTNDLLPSRMAYLAQPFASVKNFFNQAAREKDYRALAEILSDPRNVSELQRIAMTDPNVRRNLSLAAGVLNFAQNRNEGN